MSKPTSQTLTMARAGKLSSLSAVFLSLSLLGVSACAERAGTKKNEKVTKKADSDKQPATKKSDAKPAKKP